MLNASKGIQQHTDQALAAALATGSANAPASGAASESRLGSSEPTDFASRMRGILNGGALALMISVGHRTGLFDVMGEMAPSTSAAIAMIAGLSERYVREWLGAMVAGGIVEYGPGRGAARGLYSLPRAHAAWLTRVAGANNAAARMQWIAVLGSVEERIVECFREGGGVAHEQYANVHSAKTEEMEATVVAALLAHILPLERGLEERLESGIDVLDVGCGSGRATNALALRFPNSRFVGVDCDEQGVAAAREEACALGLRNVEFQDRDAAEMDIEERFDLVTAFGAIRDQARPSRVLAEIARALRPGGVLLMQEFSGGTRLEQSVKHPYAPFIHAMSCMHSVSVARAQGGAGMGAAAGEERMLEMLAAAEFRGVSVWELAHDWMNVYYVARKSVVALRKDEESD